MAGDVFPVVTVMMGVAAWFYMWRSLYSRFKKCWWGGPHRLTVYMLVLKLELELGVGSEQIPFKKQWKFGDGACTETVHFCFGKLNKSWSSAPTATYKSCDGQIPCTHWSHAALSLFKKCAPITNRFRKEQRPAELWALSLLAAFNLMRKNKHSCRHICGCLAAAQSNMYDGREVSDTVNLNVSRSHVGGLGCHWGVVEEVKMFFWSETKATTRLPLCLPSFHRLFLFPPPHPVSAPDGN